jgi:hypothetical protein
LREIWRGRGGVLREDGQRDAPSDLENFRDCGLDVPGFARCGVRVCQRERERKRERERERESI